MLDADLKFDPTPIHNLAACRGKNTPHVLSVCSVQIEPLTYCVHRPIACDRPQSIHKAKDRPMPLSMSQASLPVFEIGLNALSAILDKAEAYAAAKKIDPSVLLHSRLSTCPSGADCGGSG
jgi:Domain of unknown function (DUF1993)